MKKRSSARVMKKRGKAELKKSTLKAKFSVKTEARKVKFDFVKFGLFTIYTPRPNAQLLSAPATSKYRLVPILIAESATFACQTVSIFMDTTVTFFPNSVYLL